MLVYANATITAFSALMCILRERACLLVVVQGAWKKVRVAEKTLFVSCNSVGGRKGGQEKEDEKVTRTREVAETQRV
jgi:hypothetical protein